MFAIGNANVIDIYRGKHLSCFPIHVVTLKVHEKKTTQFWKYKVLLIIWIIMLKFKQNICNSCKQIVLRTVKQMPNPTLLQTQIPQQNKLT